MVSFPPSPTITSGRGVPFSVLGPDVPTIVARCPRHWSAPCAEAVCDGCNRPAPTRTARSTSDRRDVRPQCPMRSLLTEDHPHLDRVADAVDLEPQAEQVRGVL